MRWSFLVFDHLVWHYTRAFRDIFATWLNFAWFVIHFFSIPILFRTLFLPWKRIVEEHVRPGIGDFFSTLLINGLSRVVGMFIRLSIIFFGLIALLFLTVILILWYFVWVVMPLIALFGMIAGIKYILL